jgi:hypothetical protein
MTIRGGGNPHSAMAAMPLREWTRRLGALPAEAYDCFMVGTLHGFNRIQAWFARLIAANGRLPSDHRAANHPIAGSLPPCSRPSRTSLRRRRRSAVLDRRCARRRWKYAVGTEECSRRGSNKRMECKGRPKSRDALDKESPIQAVCPNWARTDLCGGREVTRVPTAKVHRCAVKMTRMTLSGHDLGLLRCPPLRPNGRMSRHCSAGPRW